MAEAQAVDRVHRKGQTRRVTVTRYIVPKSIETVGASNMTAEGCSANWTIVHSVDSGIQAEADKPVDEC